MFFSVLAFLTLPFLLRKRTHMPFTFEHVGTTQHFRVELQLDHYEWLTTTPQGKQTLWDALAIDHVSDVSVDQPPPYVEGRPAYLFFSTPLVYAFSVKAAVLKLLQRSYNEVLSMAEAIPHDAHL